MATQAKEEDTQRIFQKDFSSLIRKDSHFRILFANFMVTVVYAAILIILTVLLYFFPF